MFIILAEEVLQDDAVAADTGEIADNSDFVPIR